MTANMVLDHVQVAVPPGCREAGRRFYGEALGLEEIARPDEMGGEGLWFRCGAQEIHLGTQSDFVPARKGHPAFRLDSLAALRSLAQRLEQFEAPVKWDSRQPGVSRFFTEDPWGNRIELLTRSVS